MNHISQVYDEYGRVYFSHIVMWYLYDRISFTKKQNQHFWIAFIGRKGGEGKSTLAKHFLKFADPTFNIPKRNAINYKEFVEQVHESKKGDKINYPSHLIDEPENKVHILSKKGRHLRDILGKIRQLNLFVGICANSLNDIPSFIYHRLTTIVYVTEDHRFFIWDDLKDKNKGTIIADIKKGYTRFGHAVFKRPEFIKRALIKNQTFSKFIPFDDKSYLLKKREDIFEELESYIEKPIVKEKPILQTLDTKQKSELIKTMVKNNPDITDGVLGKCLGVSREHVNRLKNRVVRCNQV